VNYPHTLIVTRPGSAAGVGQDTDSGMETPGPAGSADAEVLRTRCFVEDGGKEVRREAETTGLKSDAVAFLQRVKDARKIESGMVVVVQWHDGESPDDDARVLKAVRLDGKVFLEYL
jgi:hypothetical protein